MHTGTTYVNSQTAYYQRTFRRDVDGCSAMEKNAAEEEEDESKRGWDFVNLSPGEIGFRVAASNRTRRGSKTVSETSRLDAREGAVTHREDARFYIHPRRANAGVTRVNLSSGHLTLGEERGTARNFMAICCLLSQW